MSYPYGNTAGPHRRPITPSEVRSVVFTTTRMRLGYDVEEVDAFLDQIEWSMEQMLAEINRLRRQIADIDQAHAASLHEARTTARRLVTLLGGSVPPAGMPPAPGAAYRPAMPPAPPTARRAANPAPPVWGGAPSGPPPPGPTVPGNVAGPAPQPTPPPQPAPPTGPPIAAPPPTGTPYADLPPPSVGPGTPGPGYFPPPQP
jgi:DivIVA domain-containing protein